jgi:hypothetical protein
MVTSTSSVATTCYFITLGVTKGKETWRLGEDGGWRGICQDYCPFFSPVHQALLYTGSSASWYYYLIRYHEDGSKKLNA